mgnify:CR=1 FL=1|tara:strand:- start:70 stop:228 length:159 start_codon:yes stop_codon:yes gene_type:complete
MKTYYFYMKNDVNQEPINMIKAKTMHEAIETFCFQKQLDEEDFLELFEVALN